MQPIQRLFLGFLIMAMGLSARAGQFKDGPFVGLQTGGDVNNENLAGGWQAAYEFNDLFSLEGVIAGQTDEVTAGVASGPLDADIELNILSFSMTGRLEWFLDPVGLYVGAGAGYYYFDADAEESRIAVNASQSALPAGVRDLRLGSDFEDAIGYHVAIGAGWVITGSWEVFAEYRHVFLETDVRYSITETRSAPSELTGTLATTRKTTEELSYDHGLFRIGVNYRF